MTQIPDTQRMAWEEIQTSLSEKRMLVFSKIKSLGLASNYDVAGALKWPINRVTGRVRELVELGLVRDSGKRKINPISEKQVILWEWTGEYKVEKPNRKTNYDIIRELKERLYEVEKGALEALGHIRKGDIFPAVEILERLELEPKPVPKEQDLNQMELL